jgi:hypothetical protein
MIKETEMATLYNYKFKDGTGLSIEEVKDGDKQIPHLMFKFKDGTRNMTLACPLIDRDTGENISGLLAKALLGEEPAKGGVTVTEESKPKLGVDQGTEDESTGSIRNLPIKKCDECGLTYKPASPRQKKCNKCRSLVKQ